jgi:hypothetical protein
VLSVTGFADQSLGGLPLLLYRTHLHHVQRPGRRPGCRTDRSDQTPHGVRHGVGCRAGAGVALLPGTPLLRHGPMVRRCGWSGHAGPDRGQAGAGGIGDHDRRRRHPVQTLQQEGVRGVLAPRRRSEGTQADRVRQLLGRGRRGGRTAVSNPTGVSAGAGPAMASSPHRQAGPRQGDGRADRRPPPRPEGACHRRCRLRRRPSAWPGRPDHLDQSVEGHVRTAPPGPTPHRQVRAPPHQGFPAGHPYRPGGCHTVAHHPGPRYGRVDMVHIAEIVCLWYGSFRGQTVRVVLVRDDKPRTRDRDERGSIVAMACRW